MKEWRKRAAAARRMAIKQGYHNLGQRYGRFCKAIFSSNKVKAPPSDLFLTIALNAGILQLTEPTTP